MVPVEPSMSDRTEDMFLTLTAAEIDRLRAFGEVRRYRDGEALVVVGEPTAGMAIVLSGRVAVTVRDGLGRATPVVELGPGQFTGETAALLAGWKSLVDVHAIGDVEALVLPPERVRQVLIVEAELGARVLRALMLRRVGLNAVEAGGGALLVGDPASPDMVRLQGFLTRSGFPLRVMDPATDPVAASCVQREAAGPADLPLVVCPDGGDRKSVV